PFISTQHIRWSTVTKWRSSTSGPAGEGMGTHLVACGAPGRGKLPRSFDSRSREGGNLMPAARLDWRPRTHRVRSALASEAGHRRRSVGPHVRGARASMEYEEFLRERRRRMADI